MATNDYIYNYIYELTNFEDFKKEDLIHLYVTKTLIKTQRIFEYKNLPETIAQKDLELRGPEDFFGVRQSGMPEFKLANLLTDTKILESTQEAVKTLIEEDRTLSLPQNSKIKNALYNKYGEQLKNDVG